MSFVIIIRSFLIAVFILDFFPLLTSSTHQHLHMSTDEIVNTQMPPEHKSPPA